MDRLSEIIATLNDISTDYSTDETRFDVVAAIKLIRAGAKMRQSSKTELSEATKAWDAVLGLRDE